MMRRRSYKKPLLLVCCLISLFLIPSFFVDKIRARVVALCSPLWAVNISNKNEEAMRKLEAENHLLRLELMQLRQGIEEIKYHETTVIPAHIIYRDPGQWMSTCWVDVGENTNRTLGKQIIAHNSPVLVGKVLVGVVDKVYEHQSSIRFITDPALKPSVRAVRGYLQNILFCDHLKAVISRLEKEAPKNIVYYLQELEEKLEAPGKDWLLAKGVLQGSGTPLWRKRDHTLHGIGFNYNYPDDYGPARDLRTGHAAGEESLPLLSLLKEQDILVTTGMDGVFPMGLPVAEVTKVYPLREGGCAYEIEAVPLVKNLEALQTVCILPKCDFTPPS